MDPRLDELSSQQTPRLIRIRRDIHRHPELGYQETRTAQAVLAELHPLVVTRNTDAGVPVALNVATIQGENCRNGVADRVEMTGTVRALDQTILDTLFPERIERALRGLCDVIDAAYTFEYHAEVPVLQNASALVDGVQSRLAATMGPERAPVVDTVTMTGEDFTATRSGSPVSFSTLAAAIRRRASACPSTAHDSTSMRPISQLGRVLWWSAH
jgi:metal-dependent amidase/aminoacylase/carboxypeptidase family protein